MKRILLWWRQRWCAHRYYVEDLHRVSPECVTCTCYKCGKQSWAERGIQISEHWELKP